MSNAIKLVDTVHFEANGIAYIAERDDETGASYTVFRGEENFSCAEVSWNQGKLRRAVGKTYAYTALDARKKHEKQVVYIRRLLSQAMTA